METLQFYKCIFPKFVLDKHFSFALSIFLLLSNSPINKQYSNHIFFNRCTKGQFAIFSSSILHCAYFNQNCTRNLFVMFIHSARELSFIKSRTLCSSQKKSCVMQRTIGIVLYPVPSQCPKCSDACVHLLLTSSSLINYRQEV